MSEILSLSLKSDGKQSHHTSGATAEPQTPGRGGWVDEEEKKQREEDWDIEHRVTSAMFEPSTLPCRGSKEVGNKEETKKEAGDGESIESLHAGQESRTESERELGPMLKATEAAQMGSKKEGKSRLENGEKEPHLVMEVSHENCLGNEMPEEAIQVFSPSVTILTGVAKAAETPEDSRAHCAEETEKSPFLGPHGTPPEAYYQGWHRRAEASTCYTGGCRDVLKASVAMFTAALIFPLLVWGGYVFLPFDAPLLDSTPSRLVYTLRCSVFAVVPIVLGVLVMGVSRLRVCSVKPLYESGMEARQVTVHQHYINDSVSLFLLYFLQLAVLATYLRQDFLKLVPLLTIVFAFGRLIYWLAAVLGSSVRGVGFGMTFLPILAMLGANIYFIFTLDAGGSIFAQEARSNPETPSAPRQRFWG